MASNLLPQAATMFTIPRNPKHCLNPKNFLSPSFAIRPLSPNNQISMSTLSYSTLSSNFVLLSTKSANRTYLVRSDANSEAEVEAEAEFTESSEDVVVDSGEEEQSKEFEGETEAKPPRTPRVKLGDIMGILNKRAIEASDEIRPVPDLRTGDIVELKLELPNRKRLAIYKGIIMSRQNAGIHTTIRIRRIIAGVGVEIVFPIYSPNIKEIKVVKHRKVRRARLYYLRDKLPRFSTFK